LGLFGSEYWTYDLPRRVGGTWASRLTAECLPVGGVEAVDMGLADAALPGDRAAFDAAALDHATALAGNAQLPEWLTAKARVREHDEHRRPLETYRVRELAAMSHDIFDDPNGFAAARHLFVTKQRPIPAPRRSAEERPAARVG
jgi:putative two-component system hydrogenase maturation factor HypX/HoxX